MTTTNNEPPVPKKTLDEMLDEVLDSAKKVQEASRKLLEMTEGYAMETQPVKEVYIDLMERLQEKQNGTD